MNAALNYEAPKSSPFAYFIPETSQTVKVERVAHNEYVVNFKEGAERVFLKEMKADNWKCLGKWEELFKFCNKCGLEKLIERFSINDFGKLKNPCKDCQNTASLKRYNDRKVKVDLALSEDRTDKIVNENEYKKEIKCKSFFFYQHT
jgi:hypothetical protein